MQELMYKIEEVSKVVYGEGNLYKMDKIEEKRTPKQIRLEQFKKSQKFKKKMAKTYDVTTKEGKSRYKQEHKAELAHLEMLRKKNIERNKKKGEVK